MNDEWADVKPIALLIPVWNRQRKLERALLSLVSEASLLEVVVVDDGSVPPVRIDPALPLDVHLIRLTRNQGIAAALNAGLEYVFERSHPYVARLDSDDVALAGRFRRQFDLLERHPEVGICGGGYRERRIDGGGSTDVVALRDDGAIRRGMHLRTTLWHPTVMIRTSVARRVGFFDPGLKCEDVDFFLRILDISRAANVPEPLIEYEVGAEDALTGTPVRRRGLARDLLRLKIRRPAPLDPLWWLGFLAAASYFVGIDLRRTGLRGLAMRWLDRRGG